MRNRALPILLLAVALLAAASPAAWAQAPRNEERIRATGTLAIEGECQILTDASGQQFALVGDLGGAQSGDRIAVTGTVGERTTCVQGTTILVSGVHADKSQGDANRSVQVTGVLTDEGVECQALRGDDGQLYTLTGDLGGFQTGDRVRVVGKVAEVSTCQQGTTLVVQNIKGV
jgi:opacity protein-like surface antigen